MLYLPYQVDFQYNYDTGTDCGLVRYTYNYFSREWDVSKDLFDYEDGYVYEMDGFLFTPTSPSETEVELLRYLKWTCWSGKLDPWDILQKESSMMFFEGYMYHHNHSTNRVWWKTECLHETSHSGDWEPILDRKRYEQKYICGFNKIIKEPEYEMVCKDKDNTLKRYSIYRLSRKSQNIISMDYDMVYLDDQNQRSDRISRVKAEFYTYEADGNSDLFSGTVWPEALSVSKGYGLLKEPATNLACARLPKPFHKINVMEWKKEDPWLLDCFISSLNASRRYWV